MPDEEINFNEGSEFFEELNELGYAELNKDASLVLRGILRGKVVRQALANVLCIARNEDLSLGALNFLSDSTAIEIALRKQGQTRGLVLAIENLIEQAYAWQDQEEQVSGSEENNTESQ